jgi:hypothetical protein
MNGRQDPLTLISGFSVRALVRPPKFSGHRSELPQSEAKRLKKLGIDLAPPSA